MPYAYMCECCANGCVHYSLKHLVEDSFIYNHILVKNKEYAYTNACPYVSYVSL